MTRCSLCSGQKTCVPPDGPKRCDLLFIGEGPGPVEDRKGLPFQGKTGDEVNRGYLPIIGRSRSSVKITNAIHCLPDTAQGKLDINRQKDLDLLESCANHHLYREIEETQARLLIPMGALACRAIDHEINLELDHGMPIETQFGMTFPMYHPVGGIHEPKKMLLIRTDWVRLGKFLKGKLSLPVDSFEGNEDYACLETPEEVDATLEGREWSNLAMDTETKRGGDPFCLTYSIEPGTGYLLMAGSAALDRFKWWLKRWRGLLLFHNWLFDGEVFRKLWMEYNQRRVRDTMQRAFTLGNVPLGLKALAYREMGMRMLDFNDLVTPHSIPLVLDYYRQAYSEDWGKPDEQLVREADGRWKLYKPQGFNTKLKRFFTDYTKNPAKDVFGMWTNNWDGLHDEVEDRLGPWPGKCISHAAAADWPAVIRYAARDADATLRLWPILTRMRSRIRSRPQEMWGEACAA